MKKNRTLSTLDKMILIVLAVAIGELILVSCVFAIIANFVESEIRIYLWTIVGILSIIGFIVFVVCFRKYYPARKKSNNRFDSLDEEAIKRRKIEKEIVKYWQRQSAKWSILFVIELVIAIVLILNFSFFRTPLRGSFLFIIITGFWLIQEDECQGEIRRIKRGYYKDSFGHICEKCKLEVLISFKEVAIYDSLPCDERGTRIMKCPRCGNEVLFHSFDSEVKCYKKYLKLRDGAQMKIKKRESKMNRI